MNGTLEVENTRNKAGIPVFKAFLCRVFGSDCDIVVGHHILVVKSDGDEVEIPSADTLWFNHEWMGQVFGDKAQAIMVQLARHPASDREFTVMNWLKAEFPGADEARKQPAPIPA